jgi:hypothetical protein
VTSPRLLPLGSGRLTILSELVVPLIAIVAQDGEQGARRQKTLPSFVVEGLHVFDGKAEYENAFSKSASDSINSVGWAVAFTELIFSVHAPAL